MILHYCKSLCVHKVHPYLTSIITLGYTTIRYTHYRIIICLVICVITTFLFNEKCLLMPNAKPLLSKTVIVCTYTLLNSIFCISTYYVYNIVTIGYYLKSVSKQLYYAQVCLYLYSEQSHYSLFFLIFYSEQSHYYWMSYIILIYIIHMIILNIVHASLRLIITHSHWHSLQDFHQY